MPTRPPTLLDVFIKLDLAWLAGLADGETWERHLLDDVTLLAQQLHAAARRDAGES